MDGSGLTYLCALTTGRISFMPRSYLSDQLHIRAQSLCELPREDFNLFYYLAPMNANFPIRFTAAGESDVRYRTET